MPIAYIKDGNTLVAWPGYVSTGIVPGPARLMTLEEVAMANNWPVSACREITDEEAAELQRPTPEEVAAAFRVAHPDYDLINDQWVKVRYTRKDFMLWCGFERIAHLNAVIATGNVVAGTVKDLLMASEYISLQDLATAQMLGLLSTPEGGNILTAEDVGRILMGEVWHDPESESETEAPEPAEADGDE